MSKNNRNKKYFNGKDAICFEVSEAKISDEEIRKIHIMINRNNFDVSIKLNLSDTQNIDPILKFSKEINDKCTKKLNIILVPNKYDNFTSLVFKTTLVDDDDEPIMTTYEISKINVS